MLRQLYDRTMKLAARRDALGVLGVVSFLESSVFPVPPDALLIPMVLADRRRAWRIAGVCTITSVLGGFAGYLIGWGLYEAVAQPVLAFYGHGEKFAAFRDMYNTWGAWIVLGAGLTPFPYKVITIASGVTGLSPLTFAVASVLARGIRFYLEAALLWRFGPPIRDFIENRLGLVVTAGFVLLVGGFVAAKLVGQ